MRSRALALARLDREDLQVIDVGSGTGFTTQGIVEFIAPENIDCIDQSPHQMRKARRKKDLKGCRFQLGDAEEIPFPDDYFDRYVSAGSIEYWPEPRRGIAEGYRIIKPGGIALMIGPLRPKNRFARFTADTWMLFPEEEEYDQWFREAGFSDIRKIYVAPNWAMREKYGIAIAGTKPSPGSSPMALPQKKAEDRQERTSLSRGIQLLWRLLIGSIAGFLFIPFALIGYLRYGLYKLLGIKK